MTLFRSLDAIAGPLAARHLLRRHDQCGHSRPDRRYDNILGWIYLSDSSPRPALQKLSDRLTSSVVWLWPGCWSQSWPLVSLLC